MSDQPQDLTINRGDVAPLAVLPTSPRFIERDLDDAVVAVKALKVEASQSVHALGRAMARIHDAKLWSLRTLDGRARYTSFEQFVRSELGFTTKNAYALMALASEYSADDVARFGSAKLTLVLQAPPEERPRIEKQIAEGASTRAVEREVRESKAKSGFVRKPRGSQRTAKATSAKASKLAGSNVVVTTTLVDQTVDLYAKPKTTDFDLEKLPRAKRVADKPFGVLQLSDALEMLLLVEESAKGQLTLKVHTRRASGDGAKR